MHPLMPSQNDHPTSLEDKSRSPALSDLAGANRFPLVPVVHPATEPLDPASAIIDAATRSTGAPYTPTDAVMKLADVVFEANAPTWLELAAASGVSRTQLWRIAKDPDACAWIVAHGTHMAELGLGAVHARLLQLALTSRSPSAIELYLKRFDAEYSKRTAVQGDSVINAEMAAIVQMSSTELENFLRHKRRSTGIDNDRTANSVGTPAPPDPPLGSVS